MTKKTKRGGPGPSPELRARLEAALKDMTAGRPAAEVASGLAAGGGLPELAAALAGADSIAAAELAAALVEVSAEREARRALKRALYLLEQRGHRPTPQKSVLRAPEPARPPAYVSLPDPAGHQMVIAAVPGPGGYDACLASVSREGLEHLALVSVPKRGIRELAAKVEEDSKLPIAETTDAHARYLLEEARRLSAERARPTDPDFPSFLKALAAQAPALDRPPVYGLLDEAEVAADPGLVERGPELLEDIGLLWVLPEASVRQYAQRLEEVETSALVLSPEQKTERMTGIVRQAARELFDEGQRLAWGRRLEESAFVLMKRGREPEARIALAAAIDLRQPLGEVQMNPLALAVVGRSVAALLGAMQVQAEESLIIRPGEPPR
jgi:hypothetical protein